MKWKVKRGIRYEKVKWRFIEMLHDDLTLNVQDGRRFLIGCDTNTIVIGVSVPSNGVRRGHGELRGFYPHIMAFTRPYQQGVRTECHWIIIGISRGVVYVDPSHRIS